MGKAILAAVVLVTVFAALARPWIGIVSYYLLALLGPHYIWWWTFDGLRVSLLVAGFTLAGIGAGLLQRRFDFAFLKTRLNFWVLLLWMFVAASYFLGPYVDAFSSKGLGPEQLFSMANKMFLFYFCAVLAINDRVKVRYMIVMYVLSVAYLIYWANMQYLDQNWMQFNAGRLKGPLGVAGTSIYKDENAFAMVFVTGLPFFFYLGLQTRKLWLRCLLWSCIPLGCHALFLTGSRGGLLGLVVVALAIVLKSKRKILTVPIIVLLALFYQFQAGPTMKDRGELIAGYKGEGSAEERLRVWRGGIEIIKNNPVFGVGIGSFVTALPNFIEIKDSRVAHNTLMQYTAESGIGAGAAFLMTLYLFYLNWSRTSARYREHPCADEVAELQRYTDATGISFTGFVSTSVFLSLNTYEIFFYLLILNNALAVMQLKTREEKPGVVHLFADQSAQGTDWAPAQAGEVQQAAHDRNQ